MKGRNSMFNDYIFKPSRPGQRRRLRDYGPDPFVINIERAARQNDYFRMALWTGEYLQLTLMSIEPGDEIGLELHTDNDQFIRIESGRGLVLMGNRRERLNFRERIFDGDVIFIPAGIWHNLINTGRTPLKLYSIYAPPQHPSGTVHETR
ncbi:MAG: cupin domain-containing protein, partial [Halanaerobiaceae bacterium]|nr:cupin domain-containing protein [Halanaerobiaceae bacterium]